MHCQRLPHVCLAAQVQALPHKVVPATRRFGLCARYFLAVETFWKNSSELDAALPLGHLLSKYGGNASSYDPAAPRTPLRPLPTVRPSLI
jgi:hypothetical protein